MKLKTNKTNQNLAMYRESSTDLWQFDFLFAAILRLFTQGPILFQ